MSTKDRDPRGDAGRRPRRAAGPIDLEALVQSGHVDTVVAAFPDHLGRLMGKRLSAEYYLEHVVSGHVHTCNYLLAADMELEPLPGFRLAGWEKGYGDFALRPDPSTLRLLTWLPGTACVICDVLHEDGRPVEESPRQMLKRQVQAARKMGFVPDTASELEFFIFNSTYDELSEQRYRDLGPSTPYIIDYYILGTTRDEPFLRDVRNAMNDSGVEVEGSKGEWGPGQHEVNLAHCEAVEMADRHVLFKEGVKVMADRHGLAATFMAKVDTKLAGSSCHLHTNLKNEAGGNAFWDTSGDGPSDTFRHFLAGCMEHAGHLSLFFAPTVNSYKRYRATTFAPVSVAWGADNRTCGFRTVGSGNSFRIENRIPGADVNPYLAFAATLAAGLDGIARKLDPGAAFEGNAYADQTLPRVPTTLYEAARCLASGTLAKSAFGENVVEHYLRLADLEQAALDNHVTDWELKRYFQRC